MIVSPPALSAPSGCRSQTKPAQGSIVTREILLEHVTSSLFEKDRLASFLSNVNQRLSEVEKDLHSSEVEKRALLATVDLQALDIRNHNLVKHSLKSLPVEQNSGCETYIKRYKRQIFVLSDMSRSANSLVEL